VSTFLKEDVQQANNDGEDAENGLNYVPKPAETPPETHLLRRSCNGRLGIIGDPGQFRPSFSAHRNRWDNFVALKLKISKV
jgi:hypothetical protein